MPTVEEKFKKLIGKRVGIDLNKAGLIPSCGVIFGILKEVKEDKLRIEIEERWHSVKEIVIDLGEVIPIWEIKK